MENAVTKKSFPHQCFFGMSIYDDMINYETTLKFVRDHFIDLTVQPFSLPYHQPPEPPTFEWLMNEFSQFLELIPSQSNN